MFLSLKNIIISIFFVIIFGFITAFFYLLFHELFYVANTDVITSLLGAFMGAFFAFIFVRFGEAMTKIYNRLASNESALVQFEYHFNDCLDRISDDIHIVDTFFNMFNDYTSESQSVRIFGNELHKIVIEKESLLLLTNIELINNIFSLNTHFRKLNDSIDTINHVLDQTTRAFIEKQISTSNYVNQIVEHKTLMRELKNFLLETNNDVIEIIAEVRVLIKYKQIFSKINLSIMPKHFSLKQKKQITIEKQLLIEEINEIASKDGERIDRVRNR